MHSRDHSSQQGIVLVSVLWVIVLASLYKIAALRGGGAVVAASLGGKLIAQDTADPMERKVLNVVEEMAIASGVPVPPVYVMDEEKAIMTYTVEGSLFPNWVGHKVKIIRSQIVDKSLT